jgi:hypothetical protein
MKNNLPEGVLVSIACASLRSSKINFSINHPSTKIQDPKPLKIAHFIQSPSKIYTHASTTHQPKSQPVGHNLDLSLHFILDF